MSDLIWLTEAQMPKIEPYFPLSHGVPRVDDRRIISGIIFVFQGGLRWRDAPREYGPAFAMPVASLADPGRADRAAALVNSTCALPLQTAPVSLPKLPPQCAMLAFQSKA
jgi:hypothetical protein